MGVKIRRSKLAKPLHGNPVRKSRPTDERWVPAPLKFKTLTDIPVTSYCNHKTLPCLTPAAHKARKDEEAAAAAAAKRARRTTPKKPKKPVDPRTYCNHDEACVSQQEHSMRVHCQHEPNCAKLETHVKLKQKENAEVKRRYEQARTKLFGEGVAYPAYSQVR